MKNHRPLLCCHLCHIWVHVQGWTRLGHNQYTGMLYIHPTEHPSCRTRCVGRTCKPPCHAPRLVYIVTWRTTFHWHFATHSPHVLWVHGQGRRRLGNNQYTGMLYIRATEHPSCRTRFGITCKTTMPSTGWWVWFLHAEPQATDELPPIPYVLLMYAQCPTSL